MDSTTTSVRIWWLRHIRPARLRKKKIVLYFYCAAAVVCLDHETVRMRRILQYLPLSWRRVRRACQESFWRTKGHNMANSLRLGWGISAHNIEKEHHITSPAIRYVSKHLYPKNIFQSILFVIADNNDSSRPYHKGLLRSIIIAYRVSLLPV